jgi:N6-L-threonylcarbamoyladenine synthase
VIDRLAREGDPTAVRFPRALLDDGSDDFSLSGLKTAVLRYVRATGDDLRMADVAASFQEAVVDVQVSKVLGAAKREGLDTVLLARGVAANSRMRTRMTGEAEALGIRVLVPSPALCTDNGAVVACAGSFALERASRPPGRRRRPRPAHHPRVRPPRPPRGKRRDRS